MEKDSHCPYNHKYGDDQCDEKADRASWLRKWESIGRDKLF